MYNKLFTRILDSSIWLEPTPTRIIWLTLIAAMDEDGFAQFASIQNLAHRAIIPIEETTAAINTLEAPDANSSDPENEGKRIEKVPGGWMILNAPKYRDLVTRQIIKEQTRERVRKHRQKGRNGDVTERNENVTPSDTATVRNYSLKREKGWAVKNSTSPTPKQDMSDCLPNEPGGEHPASCMCVEQCLRDKS